MPRLTPVDLELTEKMLGVSTNPEVQKMSQADLPVLLKKHSLDTESCLETLSVLMQNSKNPNIKVAVAKMGLEMSGILTGEKAERPAQAIQFVFNDSTVNVAGILNPKRAE